MEKLGFSEEQAKEIWDYRYQSRDPHTGNVTYDGVIKLTKEEAFGQGILDVEKALKGLSILNANRLNKGDIETFEGKKYAFYSLDTKGYSAEFSNDISQQTWEEKWHLDPSVVKNYPTEMVNIKEIGFIKQGNGTLTFSGTNNTYEGPTRVQGGTLELKGILKESSVYAEKMESFY